MQNTQRSIDVEKDVNIHLENKNLSRIFFIFIWILYSVVYMTKNSYNGAMASIVSQGILTKSQTGFITSMFYLVYAPLQIVGGFVSDKYSPEKLIKIGLLGGTIANLIIYFNHNYYVMLAAWVFNGIVQFGIWPSVFKIISTQLIRSDRKNMSFFISFTSSVGLILSYIVAAIVPSWEYNFIVSAIFLFVFCISLHIFEKLLNKHMKWDKVEIKEDSPDKIVVEDVSTKKVIIESGFMFLLIGTFFGLLVGQGRAVLSSVMLVENYTEVSASLGNILTAVMIVAGIAGTFIARKISGKIKNEVVAISVSYLIMIPCLILLIFIGKYPMFMAVILLGAVVCLESVITLFRTYYNMSFVKYRKSGTIAGIMNFSTSFGYMLSAYIMPKIVEMTSWKNMLCIWPVLILIAIISNSICIKRFKRFKNTIIDI